MKNSRVPIIVNLPMELERIEILLAADVHTGSAEFDEMKWARFEELLKKPDTFVIFAGDQCEYATRSSKSDVYTQAISPSQQKRWWIEHLKPYKKKVLCIVDGNHEYNRASKDADDFPLYDIPHKNKNGAPSSRFSRSMVFIFSNCSCISAASVTILITSAPRRFCSRASSSTFSPGRKQLVWADINTWAPLACKASMSSICLWIASGSSVICSGWGANRCWSSFTVSGAARL